MEKEEPENTQNKQNSDLLKSLILSIAYVHMTCSVGVYVFILKQGS